MPFKLNQDRRHHIPRQQRKVTNWPAYEAGLRQRGSLTRLRGFDLGKRDIGPDQVGLSIDWGIMPP